MIILEIKAIYREFFENRNHINFIAFIAVVFLLVDYIISLIAQEFILDHYVLLCNSLLLLGLLGGFSKQSLFLKYYFNKSKELFKIPRTINKLLFWKSIKYELLSVLTYNFLLSYAVFVLIVTKVSLYCFFCTILSICLFLLTNKLSQLFQSKFYKKRIVAFIFSVLVNFAFILTIYFSYSQKNIVTNFNLDELKKMIVRLLSNHLNVYLLLPLIVLLYLMSYWLLIELLCRSKAKSAEEFKHQVFLLHSLISIENPILKKQIHEFKNNVDKYNLKNNFLAQIMSIMMMKLLTMIGIIRIESMSMTNVFAVILVMLITMSMNGIFTGLKNEGRSIILVIQSGYPVTSILYNKIKFLFVVSFIYSVIISLTFLFCGFIRIITLLQILPLLALSCLAIVTTINLYSNLYIRYLQNETFEDTISVVLNSFCLFSYLALVNFPMLMGDILKISEYIIYSYVVIISVISSLINVILIKIFRKRFYGNYKKFIK